MIRRSFPAFVLVSLLACSALPWCAAVAGEADASAVKHSPREHYTKYEYRIPMRDGVHLFTTVYVPKDSTRSYPFLMERTPYSAGTHAQGELRYGVDWMPASLGPSPEFEQAGEDKRGERTADHGFLRNADGASV